MTRNRKIRKKNENNENMKNGKWKKLEDQEKRKLNIEKRWKCGDSMSVKAYSVNPTSDSCTHTSHQTVCFKFSRCCARATERDLESECLVCNGASQSPDQP